MIYNQWGDMVHMKADRSMRIVAGVKVRIESPLVEMTGDLTVAGRVTATVGVTGAGKLLETHTHSGVQAGASNTGGPN